MADETRGTEPGGEEIQYVREAFNSQYNWVGLIGAVAFALVSQSPLPLLLASGLELMYLAVVPRNPRYQRLVRARKYAEAKRRAEAQLSAMAVALPADMRKRYESLQAVCAGIRANYAQLSSTSQIFARQMEDRLAGLLSGFLRLIVAAQQHRDYLGGTSSDGVQREISQLQKGVSSDPPKVQEINRKRIEILEKRLEKFRKIRENHQVIEAQCSAIEDVLELIRDQSVTMKDPQQVSEQLGSLVREVEQTEETIQQVEAIFDLAGPEVGLPVAAPADAAPPLSPPPEPRRKTRS